MKPKPKQQGFFKTKTEDVTPEEAAYLNSLSEADAALLRTFKKSFGGTIRKGWDRPMEMSKEGRKTLIAAMIRRIELDPRIAIGELPFEVHSLEEWHVFTEFSEAFRKKKQTTEDEYWADLRQWAGNKEKPAPSPISKPARTYTPALNRVGTPQKMVGAICDTCGLHFETVAGWRAHSCPGNPE